MKLQLLKTFAVLLIFSFQMESFSILWTSGASQFHVMEKEATSGEKEDSSKSEKEEFKKSFCDASASLKLVLSLDNIHTLSLFPLSSGHYALPEIPPELV